ncbi:hypothetical protein [Methylomagnum ishizawai]|uniref:hypothetical protein n=1 Tax=Methylomagnum ishizawai TaxID=1760988 RepID=UPI001C33E255|nr:hypothetical protein [Methylomagnum ishizawai]BBL76778.1 hypothetical protein MishRS11D_38760 [Methylomagnum ishizawai]
MIHSQQQLFEPRSVRSIGHAPMGPGRVAEPREGGVMRDAMIERELNEHTMAAVWKYLKTIAWIHLQGLLAEVPAE